MRDVVLSDVRWSGASRHGQRVLEDVVIRRLGTAVFAYPIMWVVGVGGAFWLVCAVLIGPFIFRVRLGWVAVLPAMVVVLALSSIVGSAEFGLQPSRLISLAANCAIWIVVAIGMAAARDASATVRLRFVVALCATAACQALLTIASLVIFPAKLPIPLLSGGGFTSGLGPFGTNRLVYVTWYAGVEQRSAGIMGNPTWAGAYAALAVLCGVFCVVWLRRARFSRELANFGSAAALGRLRMFFVGCVMVSLVSIQMALSRWTYVAGLLAVLAVVVLYLRARDGRLVVVVLCAAIAVVLWVAVESGTELIATLQGVNDAREGSLTSRTSIYAETFGYVKDLRLPLVGYGIKPQESDLVASVGSHSTVLGLLFRAGVIGLVLFIFAIVAIVRDAWRSGNLLAIGLVAFIAVWCLLEDLDPGHLVPLFLVVARFPWRWTESARSGGAGLS